jgi:dipeptidyl aminopeptidase/acylaminoacyl peptidase
MAAKQWRLFTVEDALSIRTFSDRAPIRFSPDGRLLAYSLEDHSGDEPCDQVWATDVRTGQARRILPEARTAWGVSWSPAGNVLAFCADTGKEQHVWTWDAETDEARRVSPEVIAAEFRFEVPRWAPDGSAVICKLANAEWLRYYYPSGTRITKEPARPAFESGRPSVSHWESGGRSEGAATESAATAAGMAGRLTRIDIATGETCLLVDTLTRDWAVSPDGRWVAFSRFLGGDPATAGALFGLCVVPVTGGDVRVVAERLATWWFGPAFSWSPNSSLLAYRGDGVISVISLDGAAPHTLSGPTTDGFTSATFDPPLWSSDGTSVLVAQRTLWKLPLNGHEPVDLVPERGRIFVQPTILSGDGRMVFWSPDDGGSVIVGAHDSEGRVLLRVALDGSGKFQKSFALQDVTLAPRFSMDVSPQGLISFVSEDATHPADVWLTDADFSAPRRLTDINPHGYESMFSAPRLLDCESPGGEKCRSAFFPPATSDAAPPYPTVLWVYEGDQSDDIAYFGGAGVVAHNIQILTNRGYAVCLPNIPVSDDNPAQSIREALACAVKALVDAGFADPARIGIMGHSYGGNIVNVAAAGLDCFAAAVCDTGTANLISAYGAGREEGNFWQYYEHGQGRMGVPPWENPQRYIDNSPLFSLDRVTTPLLIIHGTEDPEIGQAWEMFNGLRRLDKPAVLAVYEGEGHVLERRANIIDRWRRVLAWFDKYLRPAGGD